MARGGKLLTVSAIVALAACSGDQSKLEIRSTATPLSAGAKPVPFRIAEGRAQFALGNAALALESFRKALRDDPASIDAMAGIAACYDRMGRFDLSRRHYEAALAVAPGDPNLLAAFAGSLDLQGKGAEAVGVRSEIAARIASARAVIDAGLNSGPEVDVLAAKTMVEPPASAPAVAHTADATPTPPAIVAHVEPRPSAVLPTAAEPARPAVGKSVTVALPPAAPAPMEAVSTRRPPRLERMSMGEVALVTSAGPIWTTKQLHRDVRSETVRYVPLRQAQAASPGGIRLLNAARQEGLAARTRVYLTDRGWRGIAVGDAPEPRAQSVVFYPESRRRTGLSLAAQFGFEAVPRAKGDEITVLLGRDAGGMAALRARG